MRAPHSLGQREAQLHVGVRVYAEAYARRSNEVHRNTRFHSLPISRSFAGWPKCNASCPIPGALVWM